MSLQVSRLVGHRGIAAEAPENTLTGFRLAAEAGFSWVEFDVMLSADDVPMLHHDEELGRTNDGSGPLCAETAAALKRLDAGAWFDKGFSGERIPTFEEAISCCRALGLAMNVEIKPAAGHEIRTAEIVAETLNALCPDLTERIVVSSFVPDCLKVAKEKAPDFYRGYLCESLADGWRQAAEELGCVSVHPNHRPLNEAAVAAIRQAGFKTLTYTVNDPERAATLIAWGVDAVITDEPSLVAALA
ncbi:glycerophosphodiester phosphodiesterase [Nisaea acidiphila]|uniref:Glycerophosphodiester phosphodiesterase n=1 Tax=Nisaea acidiphila TaxID=1862145 RepID=A0A9J7AXI3_9PROT|nr:glycerophosphodiester phosphodiesterase [Nisaea acidiphila]UUX52111.1 glycerophosphodiester phosphodiesterase [Nisaea acidiphila]